MCNETFTLGVLYMPVPVELLYGYTMYIYSISGVGCALLILD